MNELLLKGYIEMRSQFTDIEETIEKHLRKIILEIDCLDVINILGHLSSIGVDTINFDESWIEVEYSDCYRGEVDIKTITLPLSLVYGNESVVDFATRIKLEREREAKAIEAQRQRKLEEVQRINRQGTLEAYRNLYQLFDGKNPDEVVL